MIGSPFVEKTRNSIPFESEKLFETAFKNRIGLPYLYVLKNSGKLNLLEEKFRLLKHRNQKTLETVARIANVLNNDGHEYAVMKTLKPFPATPNDTDILYMGNNEEFNSAVELLKKKGYHFLHMAPMQAEFYDSFAKEIRTDKKGGIFHIDLYKEAAADYIIYLDKHKLAPYLDVKEVLSTKVKVFKPEAELAITLMHGVFPEQSYQLQDFYTVLYFLNQMDDIEIERFIHIVKSNHITAAISASLSITSHLHKLAFGTVPDKLMIILKYLREDKSEMAEFERQGLETPYKYKFITFFKAFWERALDKRGLKSFFVQVFHMLNPVFFVKVILVVLKKQKEGTYHQV